MSSLLPLHTSSPPRLNDDHDLVDLSPRPDDALLPSKFSSSFAHRKAPSKHTSKPSIDQGDMNGNSARSKGKGKAIAFAYQEPQYPSSRATDPMDDDSLASDNSKNKLRVPPGIWRPTIHTPERHDLSHANTMPRTSLVESIFLGRPDRPLDRTFRSDVDNTFKLIQRRERQMEGELQKLLDAQSEALLRELEGADGENNLQGDSRRGASPDSTSSTAHSKPSGGSVVPVRQPKKRLMSKRQARTGIARSVTMLAGLKNEEDAYIAAALSERKTALSKLRNLSSQRTSILAEMKALEEDHELPIKVEITTMEDQHRRVSSHIEQLEEKLRTLKRTKAELERKLEEARSTRDSSLSGYKGALRQCDKGISELMKYPGIQVLEVEDLKNLKEQGEDISALMAKHMSGFEFLSLRPERRTIEMAKDWWEGEVAVLEQRKAAVDKERVALEEGGEIWQRVVDVVVELESTLQESLLAVMKRKPAQPKSTPSGPESILRDQYKAVKKTVDELVNLHDYSESQGWTLLIVAIGAEVEHFLGLKEYLAAIIRSAGYDDGSLTPVEAPSDNDDLVDVREDGTVAGEHRAEPEEDEELSHSVVRRWDGTDDGDAATAAPPADLLGVAEHREESDNEVPPGLLNEVNRHESEEDDHNNEVPAEFLFMHSPPRSRNIGLENYERSRLCRESSEHGNEVPPDLLAETRKDDDAAD
ncbi:hypothetical protein AAE478_009548 [Parahypoxylon ruwenzoriense]